MADRVVLHIGPMKTGTSYLQAVLAELRPQLEAAGWLYPTGLLPNTRSHQGAVYGLVGGAMPWVNPASALVRESEGVRIVAATNAAPGHVLLSAEAMAQLSEVAISRLLGRFATPEVDVVITARDLERVILSSWQQSLRNARGWSLETFLGLLRAARDPAAEQRLKLRFWFYQRLTDVIARWSNAVGREHVTVVVVPPGGPPTILWNRFRTAVGFPDSVPAEPPAVSPSDANVGLTEAEALVVREVARRMSRMHFGASYRRLVIRRIIHESLLIRAERGAPLRLPSRWLEMVATWSAEDVDGVEASGVRVIGDLDELRVKGRSVTPTRGLAEGAVTAAVDVLVASGTLRSYRIPPSSMKRFRRRVRRLIPKPGRATVDPLGIAR